MKPEIVIDRWSAGTDLTYEIGFLDRDIGHLAFRLLVCEDGQVKDLGVSAQILKVSLNDLSIKDQMIEQLTQSGCYSIWIIYQENNVGAFGFKKEI